MKSVRLVAMALAIACSCVTAGLAQKLTLEDVIAKHRDSIAKPEVLKDVKTRFSIGFSSFESKLPVAKGGGKALVASDSDNLMFLLSLASKEYPYEKIGYFDKKAELPWVTAGTRSPLGAFVAEHQKLLTDGLFAGSISDRWVLLSEKPAGKMSLAGIKKTKGGQKAYCIEYSVGSDEFKVRIFLDVDTFQHIRTEYQHIIPPKTPEMKKGLGAGAGGTGLSAGVNMDLIEDFSDFKTVNGVTLPYKYHVTYVTDSNQGTYQFEWGITFAEHRLNQKLAPGFFSFATN